MHIRIASLFALVAGAASCGYGKPACSVVDLAEDVCQTVRYLGEDGKPHEIKMTSADLQAAARAKAARVAAEQKP